ncbi:MTH1187 family thiamine-binding protein [Calorimonas adulescens]|uniref:MTH1187 family thiamine-binding protein n=1 Tax=Calorimonas adulescens TaxID=2606906 RepID=A0A5D8QF50_9THEO|nr:MTH1187 family thiamine-binding protein [Calorimonas adulescens]TZE82153.1 MTH1187 family thiamine-binding protein [Calorimonas adulescens]
MAIAEVVIVPLGTGSTSLSSYVAACEDVLRKEKDIRYQLTPMGTVIEGDVHKIVDVVMRMHEVPFEKGALRVSTTLRIDDRRDKEATMEQKVISVLRKQEV